MPGFSSSSLSLFLHRLTAILLFLLIAAYFSQSNLLPPTCILKYLSIHIFHCNYTLLGIARMHLISLSLLLIYTLGFNFFGCIYCSSTIMTLSLSSTLSSLLFSSVRLLLPSLFIIVTSSFFYTFLYRVHLQHHQWPRQIILWESNPINISTNVTSNASSPFSKMSFFSMCVISCTPLLLSLSFFSLEELFFGLSSIFCSHAFFSVLTSQFSKLNAANSLIDCSHTFFSFLTFKTK